MKLEYIKNRIQTIADEVEENGYQVSRGDFMEFSVNVKRCHDYVDIESLAEHYLEWKERIMETFTADKVSSVWMSWLEHERSYIVDDWFSGCSLSQVMPKIKAGEETGYIHLDIIKTETEKMSRLEKWIAEEQNMLDALDSVDKKTVGFYGRGGGHLSFNLKYPIIGECEEALNDIEYDEGIAFDNSMYDGEDTLSLAMERLQSIEDKYTKALLITSKIKTMSKGLDFEYELKFRIEGDIEMWATEKQNAKEIAQIKSLAKKNGYILCKEV